MTMTTLSLFDDLPVEDDQPTAPEPTRTASGPDNLLTPIEAAAILKIGRSKLYELIARGRIESVKLGRCRRFRRTDLDRFIRTLADEPAD
jgi:excisionase family DNA binding protein